MDDIIARRKRKRDLDFEESESGASTDGRDETEDEDGDLEQGSVLSENESEVESVEEESEDYESGSDVESSSENESDEESQTAKERKAAFFAEDSVLESHSSFVTMNLSRPIMKALTSLSFTTPTPIQAATIPVALLGKDIVGNAVTGSGKTAAFVIPMLERLMYRERGKHATATRCLVLVPTRELAVQCYDVATKLGAHTDIQFCLVVGMLSMYASFHHFHTFQVDFH